ncbi:hypothetical protein [Microcoleus sp. FACHB-68]|nr:hypothetical protein [Microcoleus sp. FACHB-68]MBD1940118.1 hypothetical protein [Microcoleus sp. FACHB-68]
MLIILPVAGALGMGNGALGMGNGALGMGLGMKVSAAFLLPSPMPLVSTL